MIRSLRTFLFALLFTTAANAQNDAFIASHNAPGAVTWKMVQPVAKGYMMLGSNQWARTDTAGGILSAQTYSPNVNGFADAKQLPHNGFVAITKDSANSFVILNIDSNGNKVWARRYLVSQYNITALNVSLDKHPKGLWITGGLAPLNNSTVYGFVMRTDTAGNIDTALLVKGDSVHSNFCQGIGPVMEESDGSYYFTVTGFLLGNANPLLILKTDSLLNVLQCKEMPAYTPGGNGIVLDGNNMYIASATNNGFNVSYPTLLEINTSLTLVHSLILTTPLSGSFNCLRHTNDSGLVAAGWVLDANRGNNSVPYIAKTNSLIDSTWTATYPALPQTPASTDMANSIYQTKTGYILAGNHLIKTGLTGSTPCQDSTMHATTNLLTGLMNNINMTFAPLTIDTAMANITASPVSITTAYVCYNRLTADDEQATRHEAVTVFPNPSSNGVFNLSITNYELGITNTVEVYNMLGEKIYSQTFNTPHSTFSIGSQPTGLYLYRMLTQQGNLISTGKLIVQ